MSLTLKQQRFIKKFVETGNGTESAAQVYDVKNRNTAHAISSENLRKPTIQKEIRDSLETQGLSPSSISGYLKQAIISGLGQKATNSDSLRGLDLYAKLTGAYDRQDIEQSYKITLSKLNSKELTIELERLNKLSTSLISDLNS